jgi:hypothetical protein
MLVQEDNFGPDLSDSLRIQSDVMRLKECSVQKELLHVLIGSATLKLGQAFGK